MTWAIATAVAAALLVGVAAAVRHYSRKTAHLLRRAADERERARAILDTAVDGIITIDSTGAVLSFNPGAERLFGYTAAEVIGKNVKLLVPEPWHAEHDGYVAGYVETREAKIIGMGREVAGRRKDGTTFPMDLAVGEMDLGGEPCFVGTVRDLTERKRAEEELRVGEEQIRRAVSGSSDGLWDWDVRSGEVFYSPRYEELLGYAEGELTPTNAAIQKHLHPEDATATYRGFRAHLARGTPFDRDMRLRVKSGGYRWFHVRGQAIRDDDGHPLRMAGFITDIEVRRRTQEELRAARRAAEEASRAKSMFLANMSHELRTPLNAIIGYSELLQEIFDDEGRADAVADLEKIEQSGKHLLGLINEILDLSKIEAGRVELLLESFDLSEVIRDVTDTTRPLILKNSNRLELRGDEQAVAIHSDLTRVRQVLFNLLSNSAKFTEDGVISVEWYREHAGGGGHAVVKVSDTGIGMNESQIATVFEPFRQADSSTTRKYGGTGLGLTICRMLMEKLGGDISAASEPGVGSTFTVRWPLEAGQAAETDVATSPSPVPSEPEALGTVLVIDDDPAARDLLTRMLDREGYRTLSAATGEDGLALAAEHLPTAVILDVMMPEMDGWAVLGRMKADDRLAAIPVILHSMVDDRGAGLALGADEYLVKPVERQRLLEALSHCPGAQVPGRLLLVEDDAATRELVCRTLEKAGWVVTTAENGVRALEELRESRPDLILLDLLMPEMDGFTVLAEIRSSEEFASIPVVVLTAKDLTEQDRTRLNGGLTDLVLNKGELDRRELVTEVARLLRRGARGELSEGAD